MLIGRAGAAVAPGRGAAPRRTYGRRVVVVAGKGNNGNDGRDAARRLRAAGRAGAGPRRRRPARRLPDADLVIDAAYGTGFRGACTPARRRGAGPGRRHPVRVDGLTGGAGGDVLAADATVTFAALKPGLLLRRASGWRARSRSPTSVSTSRARGPPGRCRGVAGWLPDRPAVAHKWQSGGLGRRRQPRHGRRGVACAAAAPGPARAMCALSTPGGAAATLPIEVVRVDLPPHGWADEVLAGLDRFAALVIGNGLGTSPRRRGIREVVAGPARGLPTVVDADGLPRSGPTPPAPGRAVDGAHAP